MAPKPRLNSAIPQFPLSASMACKRQLCLSYCTPVFEVPVGVELMAGGAGYKFEAQFT
jgi:hypothetical protein